MFQTESKSIKNPTPDNINNYKNFKRVYRSILRKAKIVIISINSALTVKIKNKFGMC